MKKIVLFFMSFLLMTGVVFADEAKAKVKVYMFEAGGCPYCEAEEEYLKGLKGYGETFELIKKELYVDHVDWKQGKDYEIGKKVAEAFNEAGFEDASYEGTPFVVISDLYAAASYSTDLESFINAAYDEGDKDVVTCIASGKTDCIRSNNITLDSDVSNKDSKSGVVLAILGGVILIGAVIYIVKNNNNEVESLNEEKEDKKVSTKKPVKKVAKK